MVGEENEASLEWAHNIQYSVKCDETTNRNKLQCTKLRDAQSWKESGAVPDYDSYAEPSCTCKALMPPATFDGVKVDVSVAKRARRPSTTAGFTSLYVVTKEKGSWGRGRGPFRMEMGTLIKTQFDITIVYAERGGLRVVHRWSTVGRLQYFWC